MDLISVFKERQEKSKSEYNTVLRSNNGRNPLIDTLQEKLDSCFYLRQAIQDIVDGVNINWKFSKNYWVEKEPKPSNNLGGEKIIDLICNDLKLGFSFLDEKVPMWLIYLYKYELSSVRLLYTEIEKLK